MIWFSLALCFSGFSALCLGTERHYTHVFENRPTSARCRASRLLGWLLLAVAITPAVQALGPSVGLAMWTALLGLAATVQMLLLTYKPRLIVPLALGAPLLTFSLLLL